MAWIDSAYVDNLIGSSLRSAVAPTTAVFNQFEASARATVLSRLQYAGYASPGSSLTAGTDSTAFLQKLCAAVWVRDTCANRKGIKFPEPVTEGLDELQAVYKGKLPVPGMTPSSANGYGGVRFSATSGTNAREQVFSRSKTSGL